jgi:hypothetical protein
VPDRQDHRNASPACSRNSSAFVMERPHPLGTPREVSADGAKSLSKTAHGDGKSRFNIWECRLRCAPIGARAAGDGAGRRVRHLRPVTTYQALRPRSLLPWPYAAFHGLRTHQAPAPRAVIMHCS